LSLESRRRFSLSGNLLLGRWSSAFGVTLRRTALVEIPAKILRSVFSDPEEYLQERGAEFRETGHAVWIPLTFWVPWAFFKHAENSDLLRLTNGRFPAETKKQRWSHPVCVLKKLGNYGYGMCPCCTRRSEGPQRYVVKGTRLAYTDWEMDHNTNILEEFQFNIPEEDPPLALDGLKWYGSIPKVRIKSPTQRQRP
jgi:hypothetical protein